MNEDKQNEILIDLGIIKNAQNQTNEHLKVLNGKVASHEDKLTLFQIAEKEMMTAIVRLSDEHRTQKEALDKKENIQREERDKIKWMFYERAFYIVLAILYLLLRNAHIINF